MTMPSDTPPEPVDLRTRRLLLRPPTLADVDAYFEMASDPEFAVFGARQPADRAAMYRALERIIAVSWAQRPEFAIEWEGQMVGRVMLDMDRVNLVATLGYGVAREHWGRGIASEAAQAVTDYAFAELGVEKVAARVDPRNLASVRVLEKLGMQREGVLRSQVVRWGERADRALYGMLREDWEAEVGKRR
jgi:[ribosomal protein S5]-alanine N-acetyltransferase